MGPKKEGLYCRAVVFNTIVQFWTHKAEVQAWKRMLRTAFVHGKPKITKRGGREGRRERKNKLAYASEREELGKEGSERRGLPSDMKGGTLK